MNKQPEVATELTNAPTVNVNELNIVLAHMIRNKNEFVKSKNPDYINGYVAGVRSIALAVKLLHEAQKPA